VAGRVKSGAFSDIFSVKAMAVLFWITINGLLLFASYGFFAKSSV
jgi:hypothetical protein